ncbi:MAG: hypothetical protein ABI810_04110 [Sphingomonas bacterium]
MNHSTSDLISIVLSIVLDFALLGCGLYYVVFGQKLRDRRNAAQADGSPNTAKPPPDYFRLGLFLAICGAVQLCIHLFL